MALGVKICGLTRAVDVAAAIDAGAEFVGAVVAAPSRRAVAVDALPRLFEPATKRARRVAVVVDPDDALLDRLAASGAVDVVQLHGEETPGRVAAVRRRSGLLVVKALPVAVVADLHPTAGYAATADFVLFDAKPPQGAPAGGNGATFDWHLLAAIDVEGLRWGLAGGLDPNNVAEAVSKARPGFVDVASGVESSPGVKDHGRLRAFVAAARGADRERGATAS